MRPRFNVGFCVGQLLNVRLTVKVAETKNIYLHPFCSQPLPPRSSRPAAIVYSFSPSCLSMPCLPKPAVLASLARFQTDNIWIRGHYDPDTSNDVPAVSGLGSSCLSVVGSTVSSAVEDLTLLYGTHKSSSMIMMRTQTHKSFPQFLHPFLFPMILALAPYRSGHNHLWCVFHALSLSVRPAPLSYTTSSGSTPVYPPVSPHLRHVVRRVNTLFGPVI